MSRLDRSFCHPVKEIRIDVFESEVLFSPYIYIRYIYCDEMRKVNARWILAWNEIETCVCFPFDKLFDQLLISCARVYIEWVRERGKYA